MIKGVIFKKRLLNVPSVEAAEIKHEVPVAAERKTRKKKSDAVEDKLTDENLE